MADYRAKNRNTKAVDVARIRAAAKFSTPAPKVNPNVVAQKPKVSTEYSAALREQAQRGVAGARGGSYFDRSQYGSEAIFDPATGVSGAIGLATTDYNPEGIKYPTRMVPAGARGGGMVSGGQPNIGSSFAGILEAIKGMATPPPTTEFDAAMQDKYKNNPRAIGAALQRLSPEEQYQMTNQRENAKREGEYSNLLSTLKAAGLTEEELYRSAVVSPDGKINLNPNAQAAISQLGNAADSLRLLDLAGMGAGKAAGVGARAVGRTVGRVVEDIAVRGFPIPVPVGVGGVPIMRVGGKQTLKTTNKVLDARAESGFNPARSTPEVVGMTRFGGAETSKLPWEEAQNRAGSAADYTPESIIQNESDLLTSFGYMGDSTPDRAVFARDLSKQELVKKTKDALSSIKTRERQVNEKRIADGKDPFNYEPHFNPSELSQEELVTLWGNNPLYVYDKAGNIIPNLGAALGHGTPLSGGGSATLGNVGGQRTIGNVRWGAS